MAWDFEKVPLPNGVQLEQISDTDSHGVAIDTKGNIWTWGSGYGGPLDGNLKRKPTKIDTPPDTKFEKVTALTDSCSIAVDTKKQTWKWGVCNGILPRKPGEDTVLTKLTLTELPPEWKPYQHVETDVDDGYSFGVDTQNNLWVWSDEKNYHANDHGQLGLGQNIESQKTPC